MIDARGIPTCECPTCGGTLFKTVVSFDMETYEVGMYFLDMECAECGTFCTAPTPLDYPEKGKDIFGG
jgi:uncharacterized Zn finger protein